MFYIFVGAGHGFHTLGKQTHAFSDAYIMKEYEHNIAVFIELMHLLKLDHRFSVLDTAPGSIDQKLNKRVKVANDFYKKNNIPRNRALYLSVHANADSSKNWSNANGCEVLYYPGSIEGERFAKAIVGEIYEALNVKNRGIKPRKDLAITRLTKMPAVITEAAFMTNLEDAKNLEVILLELKKLMQYTKVYAKASVFKYLLKNQRSQI